jgi:hypothetical protein
VTGVCCGSQKLRSSPFRDAVRNALYTARYSYALHLSRGGAAVARGIWSDNMWSLDRRAYAALALIGLASLAGVASVDAQDAGRREQHARRPFEGERHAARHEAEARQSRRTRAARVDGVRAAARRESLQARERTAANYHQRMVARSVIQPRMARVSVTGESRLAGGGRVSEFSGGFAGRQVRVVRYGNSLSGTVDRTLRPGFMSRTFVGGGRVLYTRVYQSHVWHHFGRAFAYETFVPAVRFPAVYYVWALAAWPRPVTYTWGWQAQPWYPVYGSLFTPYPVYTSPDLWMTDYIIAQSMQTAYQAQTAAPVWVPGSAPPPQGTSPAPVPDSSGTAAAPQPSSPAPAAQPSDAQPAPPASSPPSASSAPSAPSAPAAPAAPAAQPSNDAPRPPVAPPPAMTPQVKAQLNAQIKVQLQEQQAAAATPPTLTTQSTPPALRPNHVFFQVVQPLEVSSGAANRYCSLSPDDYIKRVGGMSNDDWMIPVIVELSGPSDCPKGLRTRIGLNDLNAMENEQEAQVLEAMQAVSKGLGPNGPPSGPGAHPTLVAAGNAVPDPSALNAIRQAQ